MEYFTLRKKVQLVMNVKVFDNEHQAFRNLERKQHVKCLGVLIESNLSWNGHAANVTLKISKTIGIIARLRNFLPTSVLLSIYSFLIHPYLSYGLLGKGQTSKRNLVRILILQKKATRLLTSLTILSMQFHHFCE